MRLPLALLEVFTAIAEHGSFRAAAQALGVKPSTISHQLKQLEYRLGTALFVRTTRSVSLTEAGRVLFRGTAPSFQQLGDAIESARTTGHAARGLLKLAMPEFAYHLVVAKILPEFRRNYPEIEIELSLTDALEDILETGLHAGIRQGDLIAQDMIAIRLTPPLRLSILGAPAYFEKHGFPNCPENLLNHECIRYRFHSSGKLAPWICKGKNGESEISVTGSLIVNALPVAVDAACQGEGLINVLHDYVANEIDTQKLVPVLEAHMPDIPGFFLYFPREYRAMVPLRLFIDQLQERTG